MGVVLHGQEDAQLDQQLKSIAAAHQGRVALFAHNLKTGATASLEPDEVVQTASVIKLTILFDAMEQVRAGTVRLVGACAERIVSSVTELLTNAAAFREMAQSVNPYGDGHAASRIITCLRKFQSESEMFPASSDFSGGAANIAPAAPQSAASPDMVPGQFISEFIAP